MSWRVDEETGNGYQTTWCDGGEVEAITLKLALTDAIRQRRAPAYRHLPVVGVVAWDDPATYVPLESEVA